MNGKALVQLRAVDFREEPRSRTPAFGATVAHLVAADDDVALLRFSSARRSLDRA